MKNTLIVIKHEFFTILQKPSFWLMTFLFPVIIIGLSLGSQFFGEQAIREAEEEASSIEQNATYLAVGYVDYAGIIDEFPEWVPHGFYTPFVDEDAARTAMATGEIKQYYVIPKDFIDSGDYVLVDSDFQPMRSSGNAEIFEGVIEENLMVGEPYGALLINPTPSIEGHAITPPLRGDEDNPMTFLVPFAILFLFFFVIV